MGLKKLSGFFKVTVASPVQVSGLQVTKQDVEVLIWPVTHDLWLWGQSGALPNDSGDVLW